MHEEAQQYIKYLYCSGSAPPGMQIYEHLLRHARKVGWWAGERVFSPPCYRTVALFLEHNQAELVLGRKGDSAQYAHYLPQIQRSVPTQRNAIWGADGTAHNELAFYNGKTRQYIYGIYVFDYATARLLACEPYNTAAKGGSGERAKQYIEALSQAIRSTGGCPQVLQIDQGPAFSEVRAWCELREIKVIPAGAKNARAKVLEGLWGRLQNLVIRYRSGWSGQNQSARGPNAQPSPEHLKEHAKQAPTADEVMVWMRAEQLNEYNRKTLVTRGGKSCGKTPDELWEELPSATERLPLDHLAAYAGHIHRVKFTKAGLLVQHQGERYTYFPDVSTETNRKQALRLFSELKIRSPEGSKRTLYILRYAQGAYVWSKPWEEDGRYLGFWPLQERVSMLEALSGSTSKHFKDMRALQRAQRKQAQAAAKAARTKAAQPWQPYEKSRLQEGEAEAKRPEALSDEALEAYRKKHYKKMIHPLTKRAHWIPKNPKTDGNSSA